jgi:pimeloyl-ACP methyl ester carboxylesterase
VNPREITIELPYMHLAAKDWNNTPGRDPAGSDDRTSLPILALHGWLDNASSFDLLIPHLPARQRVVALDLPGHGQSEHRPPGVNAYFIDYVPIVFDVADRLGWERLILMGHSMGAGIGTLAAGTLAERIAGLILIDGMGPLSEVDEGAPARLRSFLQERTGFGANGRERKARTGNGVSADVPSGTVYRGVEQAVRARRLVGGLSNQSARLLVERSLVALSDRSGFVWRSDARLKLPSPSRMTEKQVEAFLAAIEAPTLMLAAIDSGFAAYENILASRARHIRRLEIQRLSGGHHLHMENPEPVAAAICKFLMSTWNLSEF